MNENYNKAVNNLKISKVDYQFYEFKLDENTPSELFTIDSLKQQGFQGVQSVIESVAESESEPTFWIYKFVYQVSIRFIQESGDNEESKVILQISADFLASYTSSEQLVEECLKEFATRHVGFHVWPYWREAVQSASSKLGLPKTIHVPFYKV